MADVEHSAREREALETVFAKGGETGALMRSIDWAQTALGSVEQWPQSLRTTVSIVLASKFPMIVFWGSEAIQLYNDAFISILSDKHPAAMGQPARIAWAEIWEQVSALLETVRSTGEAIYAEDLLFLLLRHGFIAEAYFTFSYSPIRDERAEVGGILATVAETTGRILAERRLLTLRELGQRSGETRSVEDACRAAAETLSKNTTDIPFSLIYLMDDAQQTAYRTGSAGLQTDTPAAPSVIQLSDSSSWPLGAVLEKGTRIQIDDLLNRLMLLPEVTWTEAPRTALVIPIPSSGSDSIIGFFIAGVGSRVALDDAYRSFFDLIAGQIAAAVANARSYEAAQQRAEKLAELDRAKTTFFNNVSHEFRTPLTLMLSPLEELLNDTSNTPISGHQGTLRLIQRNGLRLLKLVNTLLDFSRIEADRVQVSFEPTDLAAFTADLASMFRTTIEKAGLKLIIDCPPLPEAVYVDRDMWEKVVLNLLSNAFKFTFAGEIVVRLLPFADHIELQVSDTGVGIPEAELSNIFNRFYRVRNTQARAYEGSGIGLALVQDLVHLHGGAVRIHSQLGQGSTFTVSLQRGSQHLPPDRIGAARTLAPTSVSARPYLEEARRWLPHEKRDTDELQASLAADNTDFKSPALPVALNTRLNARIVVVEDNADMREYLTRLLAPHWTLETYSDGQTALTAIQQQRPDLVLTDVMMPGLDGFGLLAALRGNAGTHDLPIILLSARAGEEAIIEGLEAGADDYLIKPFTARELLARINAQLVMAHLRRNLLETEQAARATAEAEREYATHLLNSMSDAFVVVDPTFRYVYLNPRAQELYFSLIGQPGEAFIGSSMWEMFPGSEESLFGQTYRRAMEERIPLSVEAYFPPLKTWFEARVYPSDEGISIYFQDITARKVIEEHVQQQSIELAKTEERQRLARDLHDAVNQSLFSASVISESLPRLAARYPERLAGNLEQLNTLIRGAMAELRTLLYELRPTNFLNASLSELLQQLIEAARGRAQLDITLSLDENDPERLPVDIRIPFYRIAQESLNNIIKHARAKHVILRLERSPGKVRLHIQDDGLGFVPETRAAGMGLASMRERAEAIGATLQISTVPGEGTQIEVTWEA